MKKKILSVLFIAVIAMVSMSFQSASTGNESVVGTVLAFKGGVTVGQSGDFDVASFYLTGFRPGYNEVTTVEILDKHGDVVGQVFLPEYKVIKGDYWFAVDLSAYKLNKEFQLVIHVFNKKLLDSSIVMIAAATGTDPVPAPTDPDETILIVRYP